MNDYKIKVSIDGLDELEEKVERLRKNLTVLKEEVADVQEQISSLELIIQTPKQC